MKTTKDQAYVFFQGEAVPLGPEDVMNRQTDLDILFGLMSRPEDDLDRETYVDTPFGLVRQPEDDMSRVDIFTPYGVLPQGHESANGMS